MVLDIPAAIGRRILEDRKSWDRNGKIYASDLASTTPNGPCLKSFWYQCKDSPKKDKTPGEGLMLMAGDRMHDLVAELLTKSQDELGAWEVEGVEDSVPMYVNGERVGQRLDILLRNAETGERMVVDVKTKRGAAFNYMDEYADPGVTLQVQSYMMAVDADYGAVLYVDREGSNFMRMYPIKRDDDAVLRAYGALQVIRDATFPPASLWLTCNIKQNKGPDSVYLKVPWQIQYCNLETCRCRADLPRRNPPRGIVAKINDDGVVSPTKVGKAWEKEVMTALYAKYPNREFTLEGEEV